MPELPRWQHEVRGRGDCRVLPGLCTPIQGWGATSLLHGTGGLLHLWPTLVQSSFLELKSQLLPLTDPILNRSLSQETVLRVSSHLLKWTLLQAKHPSPSLPLSPHLSAQIMPPPGAAQPAPAQEALTWTQQHTGAGAFAAPWSRVASTPDTLNCSGVPPG